MKCPQCRRDSQPGARFCSNCGAQLYVSTGDTTTMFPSFKEEERENDLTPEEESAVSELSAGNALLIVKRGDGGGARFLIDQDITTVGRHPESDIFLDDITVSRHHAKFTRDAGQIYLEDLGSLNGTYINRTLVDDRARLRQGDEIQIGKYRATFSLGEQG